ncbi:MAG: hypothetical protein U1A78_41925 [Polyangia bacterium]
MSDSKTRTSTKKPASAARSRSSASKPSGKKPAATKKAPAKPSAPPPAPSPGPAPASAPAPSSAPALGGDKTESVDKLVVSVSGTDQYAIFGPRGPILWARGIELGAQDLTMWRRLLAEPAAALGQVWRFKHHGVEREYELTGSAENEGHLIASARSAGDSEDEGAEGELLFVGARYGSLFLVFAGPPTSFADGDFEDICKKMRSWGVLA